MIKSYDVIHKNNILWLFCECNDIADLHKELSSVILNLYLKDLNFYQNLQSKQNQINELKIQQLERTKKILIEIEALKEERREKDNLSFKILTFIKIYNLRDIFFVKPVLEIQPQFKEILKLAKELSTKNNSNFYFVYLPEYSRYQINYSNYTYNQVKQVVDELNIPFIDIHKEVFEKESNPLKLFSFGVYGNNVEGYRAGHYNVEGYRKAAEAIIRKIN